MLQLALLWNLSLLQMFLFPKNSLYAVNIVLSLLAQFLFCHYVLFPPGLCGPAFDRNSVKLTAS